MKIAIFSDCHCGYAFGEEREKDCFEALEECIERNADADLIVIAGDLFDSKIPKQEVLAKTARILSRAQHMPSSSVLTGLIGKNKDEISPLALRGIPIVCIHGTHERRSKFMVNPVQALEHAGLLIHLHCGTAIFEISDKSNHAKKEKVAVHGMSGVPERYAKEVLLNWNPKPILGAKNIFMIHQSIEPYIYSPLEPPSLKLEDLPNGFDIFVLGHIHWREQKNFKMGQLLIAGSTTSTSMHKLESEQKKGFYVYNGNFVDFFSLKNQRRIFWEEFSYSEGLKKDIEERISSALAGQQFEKKPIFAIKIRGKLPKGMTGPSLSEIEQKFRDKAIINIYRNYKFEEFEKNADLLRMLREQKLSAEEQGMKILRESMAQAGCGINVEEIFDMLVEGNVDMIYNTLTQKRTESSETNLDSGNLNG